MGMMMPVRPVMGGGMRMGTIGASGGGGGGGITYDFYADSVSGSDANDGTSLALAKENLTSGIALLSSGENLGLVYGSTWEQEGTLTSLSNFVVGGTGAGNLPYIDAAGEVVETWTQPDAGGAPNVWQITVTHGFTNNQTRLPIWEDGVLLTRVTSRAACNSTPGSFWSSEDEDLLANPNAPVEVHATDSGNPNSNGKLYEVARREYALKGAFGSQTGQVVEKVKVGRQAHNDGSITLGENSTLRQVLAIDGHKHNALQESGTAVDSIFKNAQNVGGFLHVFYSASGAGKAGQATRCGFIGEESGFPTSILGSYSHDNSNGHDSMGLEQCWFVGCSSALLNASSDFTCDGAYFLDNTQIGTVNARGSGGSMTLQRCVLRETTATRNTSTNCKSQVGGSGTWTLEDCAAYFPSGASYGNDPFVRALGGLTPTIIIQRNSIINLSDAMGIFRDIQDAARTYTIKNNILVSGFASTICIELAPSGIVSEIDYNIYYMDETSATPNFDAGTGSIISWAAWQGLGYDANSLVLDNTDISLDDLFLNGTAGLAAGDFRLATDTGLTFGDGTPIHEACGPTSHWDWSSKASASGAPTSFPTVPTNLANCETYVKDPGAWDFYP